MNTNVEKMLVIVSDEISIEIAFGYQIEMQVSDDYLSIYIYIYIYMSFESLLTYTCK